MRVRTRAFCRTALLSLLTFVVYSALRALMYINLSDPVLHAQDALVFQANDVSIEEIPIKERDFLKSFQFLTDQRSEDFDSSRKKVSGNMKEATALRVPISYNNSCDSQILHKVPKETGGITCYDLLHSKENNPVFEQARKWMERHKKQKNLRIDELEMQMKNCQNYQKMRGYHMQAVSEEEAEFPIAFNIIFHKDLDQVERLLRAIYRPQNSYCLHVDAKSAPELIQATRRLAGCFPNVFVASKLEKVVYAGYSRLQADINCMKDLIQSNRPWRYLLNLAGQAFPLKTNLELVRILKIYNGSNDIEGIYGHRIIRGRFKKVWQETESESRMTSFENKTNPPPPDDIEIVRGSAYGVFSRAFVDFIMTDQKAQHLLEWSRNTYSPDEHFWATLHHTYSNPHLKSPGSYSGIPNEKPWLAVFVAWGGVDKCHGKWKRGTCVFGVEDLPTLTSRHELFANKFYHDYQPLTLECLEAWIEMKSRCPGEGLVDYAYYQALPFVRTCTGGWFSLC